MPDTLQRDVVGLVRYRLEHEDGTLIEQTSPGRLFAYLHGHGNLPAELEAVLEGLAEGAEFDRVVPNAFGTPSDRPPERVHKRDLPKNVRDDLAVGRAFTVPDREGRVVQLWVKAVKGAQVWVTTDHPLAGKTVRFQGAVERLREPTASELGHGHAHGPDGQHAH